eukprot:SAG22_NODE_1763_length_3628_cov_1.648243_2_plen_85_part_00
MEPKDGGCICADYTEGGLERLTTTSDLKRMLADGLFAGIVCIAKGPESEHVRDMRALIRMRSEDRGTTGDWDEDEESTDYNNSG